jgi:6-phosphogluconolactonase (cycloisomerase 2 family)
LIWIVELDTLFFNMIRILRFAGQTVAVVALALLTSGAFTQAYGQGTVLLYVPNFGSTASGLGVFSVNTSTGALAPLTTQTTNNSPFIVAVAPNNRFVYVGDFGGIIDAYVVASDGTTTSVGPPFANAGNVQGLAIDASGKFLYASNGSGNAIAIFSINQSTGALTAAGSPVTTPGLTPTGLAVDNANHLYVAEFGSGNIAQYTINPTTGALTGGATIASGAGTQRLAVSTSGAFLFASNFTAGTLSAFTINGGTGALGAIGSVAVPGGTPQGLLAASSGSLFVVSNDGSQVHSFSIGGGGALTFAASYTTGSAPTGVTADPTGTFLFISNAGSNTITRYQISGGTLAARADFSSGGTIPLFLASRPAPAAQGTATVPTLSTWALIFLGLLLAGSSAVLIRRAYR